MELDIGAGTFLWILINTSANDDSLWIDDWEISGNSNARRKLIIQNFTFSVANSANEYYPITVNISNGKILPKAGTSKAGNKQIASTWKQIFLMIRAIRML